MEVSASGKNDGADASVDKPLPKKGWSLLGWLNFRNLGPLGAIGAVGLVLFLVFYFRLVGWTVDRLYDQGIFYDADSEGLISVSSPQLFTRERLINQRLQESAWIDSRIAAVDELIADQRFAQPSEIRSLSEGLSVALQTADAQGVATPPDDQPAARARLAKDPLSEFAAANYYRQTLVQEKFQSILDDAHDTYSNTLQRLNFDLTISPARHHSTSVAAVSITLEQPSDPEWVLQKYGELLIDVRDELQQTALRMINDRKSIYQPETNYLLSPRTNALLIAEVNRLSRGEAWREDIESLKAIVLDQHQSNVVQVFRSHLHGVSDDPAVGSSLLEVFFPQPKGNPEMPPGANDGTNGLPDVHTVKANTRSPEQNSGPPPPDIDQIANHLQSSCGGGPMSIWELFGPSTTASPEYAMLEQSFVNFSEANAPKQGETLQNASASTAQDPNMQAFWKLELRKLLSDKSLRVPCKPQSQRLNQIALIELLGSLSLDPLVLPEWSRNCTHARMQQVKEYRGQQFSVGEIRKSVEKPEHWKWAEAFEGPGDFWRRCGAHRMALLDIGIVHLVHAELKNTPIDTAGRVRRLDDYFVLDKDMCDLNSCELIVRTISEDFRATGAQALGSGQMGIWRQWLRKETSNCLNSRTRALRSFEAGDKSNPEHPTVENASQNIELCALMIGRQEALRLFSELSCFASARSYTVYPRQGVGQSVLEQSRRSWSLSSLFGQNSGGANRTMDRARITQSVPILGIGDTGPQMTDNVTDCGISFVTILNTLNVKDDLMKSFKTVMQNPNNPNIEEEWRNRMFCLLTSAKVSQETLRQDNEGKCAPGQVARIPDDPDTDFDFSMKHLTMAVRQLRQKQTTVSWVVLPNDAGLWGSRHIAKSIPLSAIVSLPSWWPGVQIITETCWLRPRNMHDDSNRSMCPKGEKAQETARRHTEQTLPLPYNLEDVLPKLGFFLIRYPYIDRFEASDMVLESGREVQLRITGKRLWKNPMVRLGEQWHTRVEVLPDMRGVVATFKCLAPLSHGKEKRPVVSTADPIRLSISDKPTVYRSAKSAGADSLTADELGRMYTEKRPVQVWTSEGNTSQTAVTIRAFRPNFSLEGKLEAPCWAHEELANARQQLKDAPK